MAIAIKKWDAADYLKTTDDIAAYLEAVVEDGDTKEILQALGVVARSAGMTEISKRTGLGRESLYKALGPNGNPSFATVNNVLKALNLKMTVTPVDVVSDNVMDAGMQARG